MEFRILGSLEVVAEGRPVRLSAAKHRALVARLLLSMGQVVSTDTLVDALWDEPPASADKLLRIYVSQVRKALPEPRLVTQSPGYVLHVEPSELDSARFERLLAEGQAALADGHPTLASALLGRALALWRGPALADFAYDPFAAHEIARLEELRLLCREERLEADLALGRVSEGIAELQALVSAEPLRERLRAQLMLALYRAGRQGDALEAYQEARRTLRDALGVEPGLELRRLERAILNQDPSLEAPTGARLLSAEVPRHGSPLVGRTRELGELVRLLRRDDVRIVTLTGPGGVGKSRLALEAAAAIGGELANGSLLVELGPLTDPELVLPAVARAAGSPEPANGRRRDSLAEALRGRELLLVLDNFEHVLAAAADVSELVRHAGRVKVLVTSRALLRIAGEHVYDLPPIAADEAVALFERRAAALGAGFELSGANEPAVREICARVDHLPLAIELAAARSRTLEPEELLARLGQRLPLLVGGRRDAPARQQTLRAAIDWSFKLLEQPQQRVLVRLAVFAGGMTLEAADTVCGADVDALTTLLERSLLRQRPGSPLRFELLETIREYTLERLEESGEAETVRLRHADYFTALAERGEAELSGAGQAEWLERLESEHDNFRAALASLGGPGHEDLELRLAASLSRFWYVRGFVAEGLSRLEAALARGSGQTALSAKGYRAASALAVIRGDLERARVLAERGLDLYRTLGDPAGVARSLSNLGAILVSGGDVERAAALLDEAVELADEIGDKRLSALALNNRGDVALTQHAFAGAAGFFERSLALLRELGDSVNVARSLFNLGAAALEQEQTDAARELFRESITLCSELGDREDVVWCLVGFAALAAGDGRAEQGAELLGAAAAILREMGASMKPYERGLYERTEHALRARLDERSFAAARERGLQMPVEDAIESVVASSPSRPARARERDAPPTSSSPQTI
jgi:predicted ATPase/DNA-binding SARP family transcriptional activator